MTKKKTTLILMSVIFCVVSAVILVFVYKKCMCILVEEVLLSILTAGIVAIPNVLIWSSYEKKKFLLRKARLLAKLERMLNSFSVVQYTEMMTQEVRNKLENEIQELCELLHDLSDMSTDYVVKYADEFRKMQKDLFQLCAFGECCLDYQMCQQTTIDKCNYFLGECKTDVALLKTLW